MRGFGRFLGRLLVILGGVGAVLWWVGPYEPADLEASFEPRRFGEGVQVYFESVESQYDDITPGVEKRVVWQPDMYERRTPYSVLYVHGFSATSEEIRPVPDRVAEALDANLVYTRLSGHGRSENALAEPTVNDWMQDVAEGLAAARAVGDKVVVIATSTGGTLVTAALMDEVMSKDVVAAMMVSPNFGINDPAAFLLTWPAARYWVPLVVGDTRSYDTGSPDEATYWTNSYPITAVMPLAALIKAVIALDVSQIEVPLLVHLSESDQVVRPDKTRDVIANWGGPVTLETYEMGADDDASAHVITGDIMSPGQTGASVVSMLSWLKQQGIE